MSSTLLISMFVFLPLVIIVSVILFNSKRNKKRRKSEIENVYKNIISGDQLKITEELILFNKIFAVDPEKKVFVFLHNHDEPIYDIIHLNGLSGCQIERKGTNLVTKNQGKLVSELHVNELYISFLSRDSVFAKLRVYSEIFDGQQEYGALTKVAEYWQHKLDDVIKS